MQINCEKLTPKERKDFVVKLNGYFNKGVAKLDGTIVHISDKAKISMADYFKVCNLLSEYNLTLDN